MSSLGIYFGPQLISIVETQGKRALNNIQIPHSLILPEGTTEEKVPEEIKIAALLKDELRKNKIETNEVWASLAGKDLIVRSFEMPIIPRQELDNAVNFEVKKYIPFKTEDLISDFQWRLDKIAQKTRVLFAGIKKETLDKYLYILTQSGLKIKSIEYAAFSVLKLLKLASIKEKGIIAVVGTDLIKYDETNFMVLENEFPLFSRDITSIGEHEEAVKDKTELVSLGRMLDKLKREIQISLDYYDRKFPGKLIRKIFFITNPSYRNDLKGFIKEFGLEAHLIDADKFVEGQASFSLAFIKGYSSSLSKINMGLKINLLSAKEKPLRKISEEEMRLFWVRCLTSNTAIALFCFFACVITFLFGLHGASHLQKNLKNIISARPLVTTVSAELGFEELLKVNSDYKAKIETLGNFIKNRLYLTPLLDVIPAIVPKNIRLSSLNFKKENGKIELALEGAAYLGNSQKETELINVFLARLKENPAIAKYFKEIAVVSTGQIKIQEINTTNFKISCQD